MAILTKLLHLAMPHPTGSPCSVSSGGTGLDGDHLQAGEGSAQPRSEAWYTSTSHAVSFCKTLTFFFSGFVLLILLQTHLHCLSGCCTWSQPLQPLPWFLLHFPKPLHSLGSLIFPPAPMFYALVMPPFLLINFSHYLARPCCPLLFNLLFTSHHNPWASL